MSHICDYILIESSGIGNLQARIKERLVAGWELYGETKIVHYVAKDINGFPKEHWYYGQAMVFLMEEDTPDDRD